MIDYHPKNLPASPGCRLTQNVGEDLLEDVPYREAIGILLYLTIVSRPDIAFAVDQAAQFSESPQKHHWIIGLQFEEFLHTLKERKTTVYVLASITIVLKDTQIRILLVTQIHDDQLRLSSSS
jgi:hypothetical protein